MKFEIRDTNVKSLAEFKRRKNGRLPPFFKKTAVEISKINEPQMNEELRPDFDETCLRHEPNNTCHVYKTQKRASATIFQDGRRSFWNVIAAIAKMT